MRQTSAIWEALHESWRPLSREHFGPVIWQDSAGGGNRVSAARAQAYVSSADLDRIETRFKMQGRTALFQVHSHNTGFDALLAEHGYEDLDHTICLSAPVQISSRPNPIECTACWPASQAHKDIWATGGIGPDRVAIMERSKLKKTAICTQDQDGIVFVAVHGDVAVVHALEVAKHARRRGVARALMAHTTTWAHDCGTRDIALLVTRANDAARTLYSSLGMTEVGQYHYRRKGDL